VPKSISTIPGDGQRPAGVIFRLASSLGTTSILCTKTWNVDIRRRHFPELWLDAPGSTQVSEAIEMFVGNDPLSQVQSSSRSPLPPLVCIRLDGIRAVVREKAAT